LGSFFCFLFGNFGKKNYFCLYLFKYIVFLIVYTMADNFLERQYAAYEERKKNMGKPKKKCSVKFYTRPGKPKAEAPTEASDTKK